MYIKKLPNGALVFAFDLQDGSRMYRYHSTSDSVYSFLVKTLSMME